MALSWDEAKHQRAKAGAAGGGQFISYNAAAKRGTGYGKKGGDDRVQALQRALNALGIKDGKKRSLKVDGMLGPLTTQSVQAAQRRLKMDPTGKVTPGLLRRLIELAEKNKRPASKDTDAKADEWIRHAARRRMVRRRSAAGDASVWGRRPATSGR